MIELQSNLEGRVFKLHELEETLGSLGYIIGGGWEYDQGSFDYKIDDKVGYQFLRLPFQAIDGQLDAPGATVRFMTPFLLSHKYQIGLDDHVHVGNTKSSFDQFQEPQDPDASFPKEYIPLGQELLREAEQRLLY
ncbi:YugN-like family protein [Priestia endophytica]|jgi:hypothetical protein|uniref:YugN-like family protein n=1 Tax=Priestia endophytica DSM 13796 TaxID=1121089 RepID=A0A1I6A4M7_9BACI|nr:YugN-like family protein [Priestia endophytica]KYG28303.1 hypothetical protein AZF06_10010 [Priestia endophytica]MBG9810516.1 hypothetical protein [Priestia endophytica]SFQ63628.1 YugN-like family protein [Priestia endophytica DSM 13796]